MHPGQFAVISNAGAELHQHRMPPAMHVEHFLAVQADFYRPPEHERRLGRCELVIADVGLAAEAAAVRRRDDADARRRDLQYARERAMYVVRHLRRRPERQLAVRIERRYAGVLLDRQVRIAFVKEEVLEYEISARYCGVGGAELKRLKAMDVAARAIGMDGRLGLRERFLPAPVRLERLKAHSDEIEGFRRRLLVARDDRRDGIADVAHLLRRERILVLRHR